MTKIKPPMDKPQQQIKQTLKEQYGTKRQEKENSVQNKQKYKHRKQEKERKRRKELPNIHVTKAPKGKQKRAEVIF